MVLSEALNEIDRLLTFLMGNKKPFGNNVLILGGVYKQTLPLCIMRQETELFI